MVITEAARVSYTDHKLFYYSIVLSLAYSFYCFVNKEHMESKMFFMAFVSSFCHMFFFSFVDYQDTLLCTFVSLSFIFART